MIIEKYFGVDRDVACQLIDATKTMTHEKSGDNGFQNTKVFLFAEFAVLKMQNINVRNVDIQDTDLKHLERLVKTLLVLQTEGANVVPILAFQADGSNGYIIQPRAKGAELYDRNKANNKDYVLERVGFLSKVPQEHYDKYIADITKIIDAGVIVDFIGKDNFFYHEKTGFQFIDLNAHTDYEYGLSNEKPQGQQFALYGCFLPCYYDTMPKHRDIVSKVLSELTDSEYAILKEHNRIIFQKCKIAAINSGITKKAVSEVIAAEWFIPQKQKVGLI